MSSKPGQVRQQRRRNPRVRPVEVASGGFIVALDIADNAGSGPPDNGNADEHEYHEQTPEAHLTRPFAGHHHVRVAKYAA